MRFRTTVLALVIAASSVAAASVTAEPPPPGFDPMFDGVSLQGWQGDPTVWSVHEGAIRATTEGPRSGSTFLIYDKPYKNFEMTLKYRFAKPGGNSGLQFRSGRVGEFEIIGPQANIIAHPADCVHPRCTQARFGMLTDEGNRGELVMFGEQATITRARRPGGGGLQVVRTVTGHTNPADEIVRAIRREGEWNEVVLVAYERRIIWVFNDVVVIDANDNDALASTEGLIALQANADRAIDIQFKDLAIRPLDSMPDIAGRFVYRPERLAVPSVRYKTVRVTDDEAPAAAGQ